MLRYFVRTTLAAAMLLAGLAMVSPVLAENCPNCRGGYGGAYGGTGGTGVGYGGGAGGYGAGAVGYDPYAGATGYCRDRAYPQPDLFYNFYAHGPCGGYPAQMYVSPKPVPPHVGHTYITYQPLMPHEFMYKHHRTYHQYYDGGRGLTRAKVIYW